MHQHVREILAPLMPKAGEDASSVSDVFSNVYCHCVELAAGRAAERLFFEDDAGPAVDDLRQVHELALLICRSEQAIETFISHCDVAARDLLMPYGYVAMTRCPSCCASSERSMGRRSIRSSQTCRRAWRLPLNVRAATIGVTASWRLSALKRNSSRPMPPRAHILHQIGCGNQ